jgi:hypothetical protein
MKPATITYLLWSDSLVDPYACVLGDLKGPDDLEAIWDGESAKESFPSDAEFAMSPDFPDNTVLTDYLMNKYNLIVASEKLKNFLEALPGDPVESLPVAIRDHKKKIAARYYIVNPLATVDCLDRKASRAQVNRKRPTRVLGVDRVVLRADALPPQRRFFRTAGYPGGRIVRNDLATELQQAGFKLPLEKMPRPK